MGKHTPGPWRARSYQTDDGDVWVDCDSWVNPKTASCRGGTVATVLASGVGGGSVEANAALIAAAPELLEVLKAFPAVHTSGAEFKALGAWLERVSAVIAKAEGK